MGRQRKNKEWDVLDFLEMGLAHELMLRSNVMGVEAVLAERERIDAVVREFLKGKREDLDLARANPPVDLEVLCKRFMPELAALAGVPERPPPLWYNQP